MAFAIGVCFYSNLKKKREMGTQYIPTYMTHTKSENSGT
jgi:hypothetical protein